MSSFWHDTWLTQSQESLIGKQPFNKEGYQTSS